MKKKKKNGKISKNTAKNAKNIIEDEKVQFSLYRTTGH